MANKTGDDIRSSNRAMTIDINRGSPLVEEINPVRYARKFHNGVVLPTGEVLVVGGNTSGNLFSDVGTQLVPEIWNPETGQWRSINPISVPRNYHSIALLMPDGRVISAGGGLCDCAADHQDAQFLIPHYLFDDAGNLAERPSITAAPTLAEVGELINVTSDSRVSKFSMIKLSSTTHANNTDLRYLAPEFVENTTGQYQVYLHENQNVLTPGFWMLFALDDDNVPSVAHIMQVSAEVQPIEVIPEFPSTALDIGTCSREPQVRSIDANSEVSFDITNNLTSNIQLFWVDYSGDRVPYQVILPGQTLTRTSFAGHPWVIADAATGQCLYLVEDAAATDDLIVAEPSNTLPSLSIPADQQNNIGDTIALPLSASDSDGDSLSFAVSGLPNGVSFNEFGGFFTGSPTLTGLFTINVAVNDGNGGSDQGSFNWEINASTNANSNPQTCEREGQVNPVESLSETSFEVSNSLDRNIQLFWINYNGERVPYQLITPGETVTRMSFATHPWVIADAESGDCLHFVEDASSTPGLDIVDISPGAHSCAVEGQVNSVLSSSAASFTVTNSLSRPIQLFWLNFSGERVPYQLLAPGETVTRTSFATHPWVVADAATGQCLYLVQDSATENEIDINGDTTSPENNTFALSMPNNLSNRVGETINLDIGVSGVAASQLNIALKGLPSGLYFNHSINRIFGRLDAAGSYKIVLQAESNSGQRDQITFNWSVAQQNEPVNTPPVVFAENERAQACLNESELRSIENVNSVLANITNNTGRAIQLYWLDFSGNRVAYNRIPVGDTLTGRQSYSTHPWVAADAETGECIELFNTLQDGASYSITGTASELINIELSSNPPRAIGQSATFTAQVTGGVAPYQYKWLYGDNSPETAYSTSNSARHTYQQPRRYLGVVTVRDRIGQEVSQTIYQSIYSPLTDLKPNRSSSIVINRGYVWAVNADNNSVSAIQLGSDTPATEIRVGNKPRSLGVAPDGRIWVVNQDSSSISIVNANTFRVERTLGLPYASKPFAVVFNAERNHAFVSLENVKSILEMNAETGEVIDQVNVPAAPRHLSITADGQRLYAPAYITSPVDGETTAVINRSAAGGEVFVIGTRDMELETNINISLDTGGDAEASARGVPNYLAAPAISPDGLTAWISSKEDNIFRGQLRDSTALDFEHTVRATSSKINLRTNREITNARLDHDDSSLASAATYDNFGNFLFVALETSRQVAVVDAYQGFEIFRFDTGLAPQGLAVSDDNMTLYVHNLMDRNVQVFDLRGLITSGIEQVIHTETLITVANDNLSSQVLTGKQFFYDAKDTRLAAMRYMSCASCHEDGGHDGRIWDMTDSGEGLRNTISLQGHGGAEHGRLHWTANFDEVHDFENQIRSLSGGVGLMSTTNFNANNQPLGSPKAGLSKELDALSSYVRSLTVFGQSPYRNNNGSLTASGQSGRAIFIRENCASCHSGQGFTDSASLNLHNIGTIKASSGSAVSGLDTPTLRGLWETAPYLHDGSAATIGQAVQSHRNVNLNSGDLSALVSYLNQIDDNESTAPSNE